MQKQITELLVSSDEQWQYLKNNWSRLKLPGSPFIIQDVIRDLLLASLQGTTDEVVSKLKAGAAVYETLKADSRNYALLSTTSPVLALTVLLMNDRMQTPLVIAEPLTSCPHCAHDFEKCFAGEYQPVPIAEPSVSLTEPQAAQEEHSLSCIHVGKDGKCVVCTGDETAECSEYSCETNVVLEKAYQCKNYGNCGYVFCEDHKDELTEYGYCDDCRTLTCDGPNCDAEVEAGEEKHCAGEACSKDYCEDCAPRMLNEAGLCPRCSEEQEWYCDDCDEAFTESRIVLCKADCGKGFCEDCKNNNLDDAGLCEDCAA